MACPRCGRDDCFDPAHRLPAEIFQEVLNRLPPAPALAAVSSEWRGALRQIAGRFLQVPSGALVPQWSPILRTFRCPFLVQAQFDLIAVPGARRGRGMWRGQYRQFVRGYFRRNGAVVPHPLPFNALLDPVNFQLDGPRHSRLYYGIRREVPELGRANLYGVDLETMPLRGGFNANGAFFHCSDTPSIPGEPGQTLEIHLEFRGFLVDLDSLTVLAESEWTVSGRCTVPAPQAVSSSPASSSSSGPSSSPPSSPRRPGTPPPGGHH